MKKINYEYNWPIRPKLNLYITQTMQDFISNQYINDSFNRLDIIVRLLAVEQFYSINDYGFDLYDKMQNKRVGSSTLDSFKSLILSIERLGLDDDLPVYLDDNLALRNGAHRIACALFHNKKRIAVQVNRKNRYIKYDKDWFIKNGFNNFELELINKRFIEVIKQYKIYFTAIIWPEAINYKETIINIIESKYNVIDINEFSLTKYEFKNFVRSVYLIDDINDDRIELKLKNFDNYSNLGNIISLITINYCIPNPRFRIKHPTTHKISTKVELVKKEIRVSVKSDMDNYFHDNIIHIGDNYYHTKYIDKLINHNNYSHLNNQSIQ